ncbi:MAG: M3 family metallopeptidase [Bdellovibrionota bacterium]|nr:M3 family metallopeptidase [Bdellovibrionota bacterium]
MNPLLEIREENYGAIAFDKIKIDDFIPALEEVIKEAKTSIEKLKSSEGPSTFENIIEKLERIESKVDSISSIFFNLYAVDSNAEMQKIVKEISTLSVNFNNDLKLDKEVFKKINSIYEKKGSLGLSTEQKTLLDKYFKSYVRNGALLDDEGKGKLRGIDKKLAAISIEFGNHLLDETNSFELILKDKEELKGLPESFLEASSLAAKEKGYEEGSFLINLDYPSYFPFMTYSERRDLRESLYKVYMSRCFKEGKNDNRPIVKELAQLRYERANLLGYKTHADFVLRERMAEEAKQVEELIDTLVKYAKPFAEEEMRELGEFSKGLGGPDKIEAWDYAFYHEKLKKKKFDIDDELLKPYFDLDNVLRGIFEIVNRLYGLVYTPVDTIPTYHPDVKVYEVSDKDGKYMGLFYADFFPRKGKKGGAWMTNLKGQYKDQNLDNRPHVAIVCNFTKPTETKPSLLNFKEVLTFFHEFGHSLHGILANGSYESLSGTNVYWDFVELPSQILENWAYEREGLDIFAKHYETGEKIPFEMINKIKESSNFHEGRNTLRQVSFAILDMAWHNQNPNFIDDVGLFEKKTLEHTNLLPYVKGTNISCAFSHIFNGGYSAGYYSYKWAEILDADAFELFKEKGIFNKDVASSFMENILSKGGAEHPMILYKRFRGKGPNADALLRRGGLLSP